MSDPPELLEELNEQKEEILRLRDKLIAKDVELGAAQGRVAELEASTMHLAGIMAKVRSRVPGGLWAAGAGIRRLGR